MYDTILSPIDYGGMQLKNRIIFAPTTFGLSDEEYLAEMERLAKGGCAMIIIGDVPVAKSRFEKSLFDKKGFAFYQQICEIAHKYSCKVCAQLHQTDTDMMSIIKCIPGMLMKKNHPRPAAGADERCRGPLHHQDVPEKDPSDHRGLWQGCCAGKAGGL